MKQTPSAFAQIQFSVHVVPTKIEEITKGNEKCDVQFFCTK